ncbi:MAG: hypothetical protein ABIJ23_03210 [Candidatus Magasanikbacteria bacterium]
MTEKKYTVPNLGVVHRGFNQESGFGFSQRLHQLADGLMPQELSGKKVEAKLFRHFLFDFLAVDHGENQEIVNKFMADKYKFDPEEEEIFIRVLTEFIKEDPKYAGKIDFDDIKFGK